MKISHKFWGWFWCGLVAAGLVASAQPVPLPNVIFRPSFLTPDLAYSAGMAFRARPENSEQQYLVTAHSLFGPAADLDVQMSSADIERMIVAAVGVSCTDPRSVVMARRYLPLPDARRADEKGSDKDIAMFELPARLGERALVLDQSVPVPGDKVWLYVKYAGTSRVGLEPAKLAWISDHEIRYLLENQTVDLRGTTGAPLLSAEGTLVGMHMGIFTSSAGRKFGYACPAAALLAVMDPSAKKPPSVLKDKP
jgi:hypothetical protein